MEEWKSGLSNENAAPRLAALGFQPFIHPFFHLSGLPLQGIHAPG
ncbi:MAG: hypothetical protein WCI17_02700 [bacterium]